MIPVANNIQEAINHFLINTSPICCIKEKKDQVCRTLKECNEFYLMKEKKIRNKVRPIK